MKNNFVKWLGVILLIFSIFTLSACNIPNIEDPNKDPNNKEEPGDDEDEDDKKKKQVTLTYASWGDAELEQAMIDAFEKKNPDINVILDTTIQGTGTAFTENLVTAAQSGLLPDVFVTDNVPTVIDKGLVYDISDLWNKDPDAAKVYENIASTAVYGTKRLAAPSYQFIKGIFVNKTLLNKLGIEIPEYDWTWDDFYDICEQVVLTGEMDGKPIFAINGYYGALDFEKAMTPQDDVTVGYDSWNGETFNYLNESWIKYRKLTEKFYSEEMLEQLTPEEKESIYGQADAYPFGLGQVVFGVEGSWNAATTVDNFDNKGIDVEFYPYPAGESGQKEPVILDYMCVSSQTSFPEQAFELIKWMSFGHDGWEARLEIMKEKGGAIDRYPVASYDDIWESLNAYMEETDYEGMTATIKIIDKGVPDCDKWLPGYSSFWNYVNESAEEKDWYNMDTEQLAREWTTLLNKYVNDEYERLKLDR